VMYVWICISEYGAATFGRNGVVPSYALFAVPDSIADDLAYYIDVKFFVRTRKQSGLIFFVGSNASVAGSNQTFFTIEFSQAGIVSRLKLGGEIETNVLPGFVADGVQHFVRVTRNHSLLLIQLDDTSEVYTVNCSMPLVADLIYVGGMPLKNTRRRRDTYSAPSEQFSGTLQGIQLNVLRLQLFPVNSTDEDGSPPPSVELPVESFGVDEGEQSDDMCRLLQPCTNNATCQTEFYNEYRLLLTSCVITFITLFFITSAKEVVLLSLFVCLSVRNFAHKCPNWLA